MVYLVEHITKLRDSLENSNLATLAYYYLNDKSKLSQIDQEIFMGSDLIAAKGYLSFELSDAEKSQILKPGYKGIDIGATIFKLIGAYLADPVAVEKKLSEKFKETSLRNKFLISRLVPSYKSDFRTYLESNNSDERIIYSFIEGVGSLTSADAAKINTFLQDANEVIDLIVLEELSQRILETQLPGSTLNNLSSYEMIKMILANFHNASKKITQERRKDHPVFRIVDEYDVQDLLYTILKCSFPKLKEEDPTPKVGAKSNKIDLILREDGILIEVKMIKESDSNEKPFIEQLKNDIQSYHTCEWLKYLIFFVYDPYSKTKDVHNFYDLKGEQMINGKKFTIEVILNPI